MTKSIGIASIVVFLTALVRSLVGAIDDLPKPVAPAKEVGVPFDRYQVKDELSRDVTYYLSTPPKESAGKPLPLVLWVQGSGCDSLFSKTPDGRVGGGLQNLVLKESKGRCRVMAVEKPGVKFCDSPARHGTCDDCSEEFKNEYAADRWAVALEASLRDVIKRPDIDRGRVLAAGHSEGASMVAKIAADVPEVTHVACLSGAGSTQLFDMAQIARRGLSGGGPRGGPNAEQSGPDGSTIGSEDAETREARVEDVYRQAAEIAADPDSVTKTAWGHTFKRWSSFFRLSPVAELKKSRAKIYLAYGTADQSVPVESNDLARAELFAAGRDVTCERIVGADHGYQKPGEQGYAGMNAIIGRVVEWFLSEAVRGAAEASSQR